MSIVLAINTSEKRGEILLADEVSLKTIAQASWGSEFSHSEVLAPRLYSLLESCPDFSLKDISGIFVVEGPGSFTGLRVGVNFAKTLAYGNRIPIAGINTLQALALSVAGKKSGRFIATVDAQKNSLFFSEFRFVDSKLVIEKENQKIPAEQIENFFTPDSLICGSGWLKYKTLCDQKFVEKITSRSDHIDLSCVLEYQKKFLAFSFSSWELIQPRYFKKSTPEELLDNSRQRS